jgi:hypothetical protein
MEENKPFLLKVRNMKKGLKGLLEYMKVFVSVKQAGKRKEYITKKELVLNETPTTLRELIREVIRQNVTQYNQKSEEPSLLKLLSFEELEAQVQTGKVGFGERFNREHADPLQAVETAMTAFEDGLFRVFIGDEEAPSLDEHVVVNDGDVLTFIKFTMLSGRLW